MIGNNWTKGNTPEKSGWYWLTVLEEGKEIFHHRPERFEVNENNAGWESAEMEANKDKILAHMYISMPTYSYKRIGNGYFIAVKRDEKDDVMYYAKGLQSHSWSSIGYSDIDKAVAALKRLRKVDQKEYPEYFPKWKYWIVNGPTAETVWEG